MVFGYPKIYILIMHELYMAKNTTINIEKVVREELSKCRKYKRETYSEILKRLMKNRRLLK